MVHILELAISASITQTIVTICTNKAVTENMEVVITDQDAVAKAETEAEVLNTF